MSTGFAEMYPTACDAGSILGSRLGKCFPKLYLFLKILYPFSVSHSSHLGTVVLILIGGYFGPREHVAMSGDIFGCWNWVVLPASGGWRPGMLLNIVQGTGQLPTKNDQPQIPTAARLRNSALPQSHIQGLPSSLKAGTHCLDHCGIPSLILVLGAQ